VRVVIHTNVFVSGLMLPKSVPGKIIAAWAANGFTLVISEPLMLELERALFYPKIRPRILRTDEQLSAFHTSIRLTSSLVEPGGHKAPIPKDIDDALVLQTLIAGQADYLISADHDLLVLSEHYPIVTPAEFSMRHL